VSHGAVSRIVLSASFARFTEHVTAELQRSEMRCEYVFGDASMRRKPRITGATVALVGVHVNISINMHTVTVNNTFTLEALVLLQRFIR
jgi:hypothetical protein